MELDSPDNFLLYAGACGQADSEGGEYEEGWQHPQAIRQAEVFTGVSDFMVLSCDAEQPMFPFTANREQGVSLVDTGATLNIVSRQFA